MRCSLQSFVRCILGFGTAVALATVVLLPGILPTPAQAQRSSVCGGECDDTNTCNNTYCTECDYYDAMTIGDCQAPGGGEGT